MELSGCIILGMRFLWWLSKSSKARPADSPGGPVPGESEHLGELPLDPATWKRVIEENIKSITALVTAINRIERKQNRWIELLNMQDMMKAAESAPLNGDEADKNKVLEQALAARQPPPAGEFVAGEATEE